ncbi:MAG: LacI family DNA-binding transcriptional regulator [Terriglobia bacterium]
MAEKPTLRQLAETAGVSLATVSRIVNGSARVGPELHNRVREAARELGIDLHQANRSRSVAFVLSNREMLHSFHSRILVGAQNQCAFRGWDMLFMSFSYAAGVPAKDLHLPTVLRRRDVARAVILAGNNSQNLLTALQERGSPFAVLGNNLLGEAPPSGGDVIYSDDVQGAYEMTRYLQSLRHRHIGYIGNSRLPWLARCARGYSKAMQEAGLEPCEQDIDSTSEQEIGYLGAKLIFGRPERVTAIFTGTDPIAAGVYKAAVDCFLRIPEDLAVAGCNDTLGDLLHPRLTTIREFPEQLGKRLVDMVLTRIEQPELGPRRVTIPTELVKRESCHPLFNNAEVRNVADGSSADMV